MTTANEILMFLKENKMLFKERYHCTEIGIFGSFARNEQTDKSDIDIIVEYEPGTPDLYVVELELKRFLKSKFNREIDICSKKWIKPLFRNHIINSALYA
jgi:uncharacterized protein